MADPFSTAVAILAVIGATGKTFQGLQKAWELRYMDEDFLGLLNEVTGLKTQLQAAEMSLEEFTEKDLSHEPLQVCISNIDLLGVQAQLVLVDIDKFVGDVVAKSKERVEVRNKKPSKKKWLRRRSTLIRLTTRLHPVVNSITTATLTLRNILSDQKLKRLDLMLANLTIQNIEVLGDTKSTGTTTNAAVPLETKLELSISQAIQFQEPTRAEISSRRSSIDSFHSAVSSSSESASSIVSITGTLGTGSCEPFCACQCHISNQIRTPKWAKLILGTMTFHGNGSILLNRRPCNKACRQSGPASIQFSYFAPAWLFLRSLSIFVKAQSIHGLDFNIRMPRVIPKSAPVWSLIELGKLSNLRELVSQNAASPFDVNIIGKSLLFYAAMQGQNEIYQYLLSLKADPYFRDESGMAANQPGVDRALSGMNLDRVVSTTARAASSELFVDSMTLDQQEFNFIHLVVLGFRKLDLDVVLKQYLSPQTDIDSPDINGRTPLIWAAWRGDVESVDLLLSSRADINKTDHQGYSALAKAARAGHLDCVQRLLRAGASIKIADKWGLQPIHRASSNKANGLPIVEMLLQWGADPNASSERGGALHLAVNRGSLGTVKCLLLAGADMNALDPDGDSPAMIALLCWNRSIFSYLALAGAKLNHTRYTGENILHLAVWSGSTDIWDSITNLASSEQMSGVDAGALHNGHGLRHCFDNCRDLWYVGDRESKEEEEAKFKRMTEAFDTKPVP